MAKWLARQTAVLEARVRAPLVTPDCKFSVQCKVSLMPLLDRLSSSSLVNSVNMP